MISKNICGHSDALKNLHICAEIILKSAWKSSLTCSQLANFGGADQDGIGIPNITNPSVRRYPPLIRHDSIRVKTVGTRSQGS